MPATDLTLRSSLPAVLSAASATNAQWDDKARSGAGSVVLRAQT
jgi:hypothetical protein